MSAPASSAPASSASAMSAPTMSAPGSSLIDDAIDKLQEQFPQYTREFILDKFNSQISHPDFLGVIEAKYDEIWQWGDHQRTSEQSGGCAFNYNHLERMIDRCGLRGLSYFFGSDGSQSTFMSAHVNEKIIEKLHNLWREVCLKDFMFVSTMETLLKYVLQHHDAHCQCDELEKLVEHYTNLLNEHARRIEAFLKKIILKNNEDILKPYADDDVDDADDDVEADDDDDEADYFGDQTDIVPFLKALGIQFAPAPAPAPIPAPAPAPAPAPIPAPVPNHLAEMSALDKQIEDAKRLLETLEEKRRQLTLNA